MNQTSYTLDEDTLNGIVKLILNSIKIKKITIDSSLNNYIEIYLEMTDGFLPVKGMPRNRGLLLATKEEHGCWRVLCDSKLVRSIPEGSPVIKKGSI